MKILIPAILCLLAGCSDSLVSTDPARKNPLQPRAVDDIGEFEGDKQVVEPDVVITNPITGPLEAFEPIKQRLASLAIEKAVSLFHASEGRYPKDHDEFMQRIIKANSIRLPEPAKGFSYEYDVENHKLVVVRVAEEQPND